MPVSVQCLNSVGQSPVQVVLYLPLRVRHSLITRVSLKRSQVQDNCILGPFLVLFSSSVVRWEHHICSDVENLFTYMSDKTEYHHLYGGNTVFLMRTQYFRMFSRIELWGQSVHCFWNHRDNSDRFRSRSGLSPIRLRKKITRPPPFLVK